MDCENEFCIYQKNGKCLTENVEHDARGCCQNCIYPDIPSDILEKAKEELRRKYDEEDKGGN